MPLFVDTPAFADSQRTATSTISPGRACAACLRWIEPGDRAALVPLGPGSDPDEQARARRGEPYRAVALALHWGCATGETEPRWEQLELPFDDEDDEDDEITAYEADVVTTLAGPLRTHAAGNCAGEHCCIHNPSDHLLRDAPFIYRSDRIPAFMERQCPHGIGHPDPDSLTFLKKVFGGTNGAETHGCDGCC